jgi:hypothetical protein
MVCKVFFIDYLEVFSICEGCGAQEENLHRRTNLFQCLEDSYNELEGKRDWSYPIPEVNFLISINNIKPFFIVWWYLFSRCKCISWFRISRLSIFS